MTTTEKQVFDVIDELTADGEKVTNPAIRERLGGGSYSKISAAHEAYRVKMEAVEAAPQVVADTLLQAAASSWSVASREADEAIQNGRQELQDAEQQLQEEAREQTTMIGMLELELEISETANRKLREEAAADAARRDSLHASIERLTGLLEASQKSLADLRERHQAQAREFAVTREELAKATARIVEIESARMKPDPEPEAARRSS